MLHLYMHGTIGTIPAKKFFCERRHYNYIVSRETFLLTLTHTRLFHVKHSTPSHTITHTETTHRETTGQTTLYHTIHTGSPEAHTIHYTPYHTIHTDYTHRHYQKPTLYSLYYAYIQTYILIKYAIHYYYIITE